MRPRSEPAGPFNTRAETLKRTPIFSGLAADEIDELARTAVERRFGAGEPVFWEGDEPEWFYIVTEGQVKIVKQSSSGKEFIVAFFGPADMFGEVAVFENEPYPASAVAAGPLRVTGIPRQGLLSFLASRPQVSLKIISVLGRRLREAQARLKSLAGEKVEQRLAATLLTLSSQLGPTLPFTRQEIADMTGTTTETATRILGRLKERGIVRSTRGRITIVDELKLRAIREGPPAP